MKSAYQQSRQRMTNNNTHGVKSAEGDNIKYPRVKKAFQVEQPSISI